MIGCNSFPWAVAVAAVLAFRPAAAGDIPQCTADGATVTVYWGQIDWFLPILGYGIVKDDEKCTTPESKCLNRLPPDAIQFVDQDVSAGDHLYILYVIDGNGAMDEMGRCTVTVAEPGRLTCTVDGRTVHLVWTPLVIDVVVRNFVVYRNGDKIATLPGNQFKYDDVVPTVGEYAYKVVAVVGGGGVVVPVGDCHVSVPCFGMSVTVVGLEVFLEWDSPTAAHDPNVPIFTIKRDGVVVGRAAETKFVDTVPAAGTYLYEVWYDPGSVVPRLIGACLVRVDPAPLPPPRDLVCTVAGPPPTVPDDFPGDVDVSAHDTVVLAWRNPVLYDSILIVRDGAEYAKLPGTRHWFIDFHVPAGAHTYGVIGIRGGIRSEAAKCEVVVPGSPVPPPQNLVCLVGRYPDVLPDDFPPDIDPAVPPAHDTVLLVWRNPIIYDSILIVRDGAEYARLPGTRHWFLDFHVPPGTHSYGVIGTAGGQSSDAAKCEVVVPGSPPPPVDGLTCTVQIVSPGTGDTPDAVIAVLLQWKDPVTYDSIVVARNGMTIATLPGTTTSFIDHLVRPGTFIYDVIGILAGLKSDPASCTVEVPPPEVPPPQDLACVVMDVLLRAGDGDVPPDIGSEIQPAVGVVPVRAVVLKWTDPIHYASIIVYRDRGILAKIPGDAMMFRDLNPPAGRHLYGVQGVLDDGRKSDITTCWVEVGEPVPPVDDLACTVIAKIPPDVALSWKDPVAYDAILVVRKGDWVVRLAGDATGYTDKDLEPGVYVYEVIAVVGDRQSVPATCQVTIPGPMATDTLFFSTSSTSDRRPADAAAPASRITCLLSNSSEVQGWSFGVQTDPAFVVPARYDLDGTVTAAFHGGRGPDFLVIDVLPEGVTMAAVIDAPSDPSGIAFHPLPPGEAQPLLDIEYVAGPSGVPGGDYPVTYSATLGSPPVQVLLVVDGFEVRPATLTGTITLPADRFIRGDADGSGTVELTDAIVLLTWMFLGGDAPGCLQSGDANATGDVNIGDPIYVLGFLYIGYDPPAWPYPGCGPAPAPLGCANPGSCK